MNPQIIEAWSAAAKEAPIPYDQARELAFAEVRAGMPGVSDDDAQLRGRVMRRTMELTGYDRSKVDPTGLAMDIRAARIATTR